MAQVLTYPSHVFQAVTKGCVYTLQHIDRDRVLVGNLENGNAYEIVLRGAAAPICSCPDARFRNNLHCKHIELLEQHGQHIGVDLRRPLAPTKPPEQPRNPDFCPGSEVADHRHGWVHVNALGEKRTYWVCTFCGKVDETR